MTPEGLLAVGNRIADIRTRFGPTAGFQAALQSAQRGVDRGDSTNVSGTAITAPQAGTASSTHARIVDAPASRVATGQWVERLPEAGRRWAGHIDQAARSAGIEPELLAAVVQAESNFRPDVVSHAGAIGLAQLMPGTAAGLGVDPRDPQENLAGGARYLREQLDRFGSVELALAAYNAGPNRVASAGGVPQITETQNYVRIVRENYLNLR